MYFVRTYNVEKEKNNKISGMKPLLARLLSQRQIEDVDAFLTPKPDAYLHLRNSNLVQNVKDVASLLVEVAKSPNKNVSVSSDYDSDGIVSSYMVKRICDMLNIECNVFLPSRFEQGYGLNEQTIGALLAFTIKNKTPELLVILDCGSSSESEVKKLQTFAIPKIIILDHHPIKEENFSKSANVVVNWHMSDAQEMCTCGLVYLVALDLLTTHKSLTTDNIQELLALAAIGTIADVTPIIGDNRIIVKQGLRFFDKLSSEGLTALVKLCKLDNKSITQEQIGFRLAPRLNAVGRLDSPQEAFDLLVSKNQDEIDYIIQVLEITNKNRQDIQKEILDEAIAMFNEKEMEYGILLVNPKWNIGVVGVVASEMVEKFHKPTVVIGRDKAVLRGSGRSIKGLSLIKILDVCQEMFDKYGGHDYAAGVTLKKNYLDKAIKMFNDACQQILIEENKNCDKKIFYDAVLKPETINEDTYKIVDFLYPYCDINNPEPVFKLAEVKTSLIPAKRIVKPNWTLSILKVDGVKFEFKTFNEDIGKLDDFGKKSNVYFKFPQCYDGRWPMQLSVVGIEVLEK